MIIYCALVVPSHAVPVQPDFWVYAVGMQFIKHFRCSNLLWNECAQSHCALVSLCKQHLTVLFFSTRTKLKISVLIFTGIKFDVFYRVCPCDPFKQENNHAFALKWLIKNSLYLHVWTFHTHLLSTEVFLWSIHWKKWWFRKCDDLATAIVNYSVLLWDMLSNNL